MMESPPKRGRFQFSLRTWFVVVLILALTMPCWPFLLLSAHDSMIPAVPAAFFWFVVYKQLRTGAIFCRSGNPWNRERNPTLFGIAVVVSLILAILSSVAVGVVFEQTVGPYFV